MQKSQYKLSKKLEEKEEEKIQNVKIVNKTAQLPQIKRKLGTINSFHRKQCEIFNVTKTLLSHSYLF